MAIDPDFAFAIDKAAKCRQGRLERVRLTSAVSEQFASVRVTCLGSRRVLAGAPSSMASHS